MLTVRRGPSWQLATILQPVLQCRLFAKNSLSLIEGLAACHSPKVNSIVYGVMYSAAIPSTFSLSQWVVAKA